jgi:hypothetical protein
VDLSAPPHRVPCQKDYRQRPASGLVRLLVAASVLLLAVSSGGCLHGLVGGGASPYDDLRDSDYKRWTIEVDAVAGQEPSPAALDFLKGRLGPNVDKPDGITFATGGHIASGKSPWTKEDVLAASDQFQDHHTKGGTVVTHLLFLDGRYEQQNVLGVTIGYRTIAIFPETIAGACSLLNACFFAEEDILNAVLVHEFGHAMGLVNRGIPMVHDHEDPQSHGHSSNPNSVMTAELDSAASLGNLNTIPNQYDADDVADMREAR